MLADADSNGYVERRELVERADLRAGEREHLQVLQLRDRPEHLHRVGLQPQLAQLAELLDW